jgi:hypothetical protein
MIRTVRRRWIALAVAAVFAVGVVFEPALLSARASGPAPVRSASVPATPAVLLAGQLDCDGDGEPVDPSELTECDQGNPRDQYLTDNEKLAMGALLGLVAAGVVIGATAYLAPAVVLVSLGEVGYALALAWGASGVSAVGGGFALGSMFSIGYIYENIDPPARTSWPIPVPQPRLGPSAKRLGRYCAKVSQHRKAECHRLMADAAGYLQASARVSSIAESMATNGKAFADAHRFNSRVSMLRILGTEKVFGVWLEQALRDQQTAGVHLAREMRRAHVNIKLSRKQSTKLASKLGAGTGIRGQVIDRLRHEIGLNESQVRQLAHTIFKRAARGGVPFDLRVLLERKLPSTDSFRRDYRTLSLLEVYYLVVNSPASESVKNTLTSDLNEAHQACTPAERQAPISDFINRAHGRVGGVWGRFLADAAKPLLGRESNPDNLPPVATFRPHPSNPKLGKGGAPVAVSFDAVPPGKGDPNDGGSTACWKWDFGDPASGAQNVSTTRTAAHTFSAAGDYTITLVVVDDDGWAHAKSSQVVTVKPPS